MILLSVDVINECVLSTLAQLMSILQYSVVVFDNSVLMNYIFLTEWWNTTSLCIIEW